MSPRIPLLFALFAVSLVGCSDSDANEPNTQMPASTSDVPATNSPATQIAWTDFPLGTTCPVESPPLQVPPQKVGFGRNPFCLAWRDAFSNETGFRVILNVGGQEQSIVVPANVNELFPPGTSNTPAAFQFRVLAILPSGEQLIDGMAFTL